MNIIIDLKKTYSPCFVAFIKARGLKNGDVCKGYEYIDWITDKHEEFRKKDRA